MKRFVTLFLFLMTFQFTFGQSFLDSDPSGHTAQTTNREVLNISGDITSNNFYVSGTSMDLLFTFSAITPDQEFADVVTLTFPAGMVPTAGNDTFPGYFSSAQSAAKLNPIDGQIISWGTNNGYGGVGISANGSSYSFFVTVTIDTALTGDQTVAYHVSGDEYNAAPHEFSGSFVVGRLPATPELSPSITGQVLDVFQIPLPQATFNPSGSVVNNGSPLAEAVDFNLAITGGYSNNVALPNPLGTDAPASADFPVFTAPAAGTYTFDYSVNLVNDADPSNDSNQKDIEVGSVFAREDGNIDGYIGISSTTTGGEIGQIFTLTQEDTVTSIQIALNNTSGNIGDTISVKVRAFGTEPGAELGKSLDFYITEADSAYEATLLTPTILAPGTYYFGAVEGAGNMSLAHCDVPFVPGTSWAYFNNVWNKIDNFGHTYLVRPVFNDVVWIANDIRLNSISVGGNIVEGNTDISGTITNTSNTGDMLTSFDVQYTADGTASTVYSITGLSIAPGATYDFTHDVPFNAVAGKHVIEVTVSNPNGATDERPNDNSLTETTKVVKETYKKVVVGEEATGTWCGWCVRGHVGLKDMEHNHNDGTWIGIAVHNGDPMVNEEYDARIGDYIDGYPSGVINRLPVKIDPGNFEDAYGIVTNFLPYAKVDVPTAEMIIETRTITVNVSSTFALDLAESNTRLSLIVVEDSVTGTASDYAQANYYARDDENIIDWEGINWKTLGNPIPATDMIYNHVGRYIVGGFDGVDGSIPAAVTYDTPVNYEFTTTLPADYDAQQISVVVLLINTENGQIVNAAKADVDVISGNTNIGNADAVKLSPNPTKGQLTIDAMAGSTITVYDVLGRLVLTSEMPEATKTIDLSVLENGSYWVEVFNNNTLYSKQVILTK